MRFSIWVLSALVAELVLAVELLPVCAAGSCHGADARSPEFSDAVREARASMAEGDSNRPPRAFGALKPDEIKPWIGRRNRELKNLCQRSTDEQRTSNGPKNEYRRALEQNSTGANQYYLEYHTAISEWNAAGYEKLRRQFHSAERRGQVVIMGSNAHAQLLYHDDTNKIKDPLIVRLVDQEHINAASVWTELGIDVLFYFEQDGKHDVGDMIRVVGDLALEAGAQVDVLLQDHVTAMFGMITQDHLHEVLRDIYKKNKSLRLAILTCGGQGLLDGVKNTSAKMDEFDKSGRPGLPPEKIPEYESMRNGLTSLKSFETQAKNTWWVLPTEGSLSVQNGCLGRGIYHNPLTNYPHSDTPQERDTHAEGMLNAFFGFKVFQDAKKQRHRYKQACPRSEEAENQPCRR